MLLMLARGWTAWVSADWIELIVVMTELIAEEAVDSTAWLCASADWPR